MNIEQEISAATKIKAKKGQDRQEFLSKLAVAATDEIPEDAWEKLSDEAQTWANEAVKAFNSEEEIPEPVKMNGAAVEGEGEAGDKPQAAKKAAKAPSKKAAGSTEKATSGGSKKAATKDATPAKKAAGKAPSASTGKKASEAPAGGSMTYLKELLIKDINTPNDKLVEKMRAKGYETSGSCIGTWKSYFRHSIKVLKANGVDLKNFEV